MLLTTEEVAQALKLSDQAVRVAAREAGIAPKRLGNGFMWTPYDVGRLLVHLEWRAGDVAYLLDSVLADRELEAGEEQLELPLQMPEPEPPPEPEPLTELMLLHPQSLPGQLEPCTTQITGVKTEGLIMSSKKKTKKAKSATAKPGGPRKCSVCQKRGHNARSHEPGGLLA